MIVKNAPDGNGTFEFTSTYAESLPSSPLCCRRRPPPPATGPGVTYNVDERPDRLGLTCATCDNGDDHRQHRPQAGETVTCTFTNTQHGKIIVEKQTVPDGATGSFGFTGALTGSIGDNGKLKSLLIPPGTYYVTDLTEPRTST